MNLKDRPVAPGPALSLKAGDALLVVDVQVDFLAGGPLAVPRGDEVVPVLNAYLALFLQAGLPLLATRDWHPVQHLSFQAQGGPWPVHGVAGTAGAGFAPGLQLPTDAVVISKASEPLSEAYSGFEGADLDRVLRQAGVGRLFVGGLVTDYCVLQTVLDALAPGYQTLVLQDAVRAVERQPGDGQRDLARMLQQGGPECHAATDQGGIMKLPPERNFLKAAGLAQAQLVETRLINLLQLQTMMASKAVRSRLAAPDKLLVDFGLRRAHGAEAGLLSARARFIAGFDGSSNVLAGVQWDLPLHGTMAHSFVQVHDTELQAFEHFARSHPNAPTLLIDTNDTEAAARHLLPLARRLAAVGIALAAVRLDDDGLNAVRIFVSGNLDEYLLAELLAADAPIDGFGVGTRMNTAADYPCLDCAYKLQEYAGLARRKRSEGKATWPGRKQVYRRSGADGLMAVDVLTTTEDAAAPGEPLLVPVMRQGRRLAPPPCVVWHRPARLMVPTSPPRSSAWPQRSTGERLAGIARRC